MLTAKPLQRIQTFATNRLIRFTLTTNGNKEIPVKGILAILFAVAIAGLSILIWLTPVSAAEMTPAQDRLMNIGDWMLKAAVGVILGFGGGRLAARN